MPSQLESFFLHGLLFFFQLLWFDLDVILSLYKGVHHFTLAPLTTVTVQTLEVKRISSVVETKDLLSERSSVCWTVFSSASWRHTA